MTLKFAPKPVDSLLCLLQSATLSSSSCDWSLSIETSSASHLSYFLEIQRRNSQHFFYNMILYYYDSTSFIQHLNHQKKF